MTATEAHDKGLALQAKANIHQAMALFTQHWGLLHRLLGEETCEQSDRGNAWRDAYEGMDGTGHESINSRGEFCQNDQEACLTDVEGIGAGVRLYRNSWKGFIPDLEQAEQFDQAMELLKEAEAALDQADEFIRACQPVPMPEASTPVNMGLEGEPNPGS